jgi:hypothetical protein
VRVDGAGLKGGDSGAYISDLGGRIFELPRCTAALAEIAMVKSEGGVAPLCECLCIGARSLFLDARQRAGCHQRRTGSTLGQMEQTDQAVAVTTEFKALLHGPLLSPFLASPLFAGRDFLQSASCHSFSATCVSQ